MFQELRGFKFVGLVLVFCATSAWACVGPTNAAIQDALSRDLSKYKNVTVSVDDCVAVLGGQVERLSDKLAAARHANKYGALSRVDNQIAVVVPVVDDRTLVADVSHALLIDREQRGNMLSFAVSVHGGAVTLSGTVFSPMQHDNVVSTAASVRGVRELVDAIQVSPFASLSPILYDPRTYVYGTACAGTIAQCGNEH